MSPIFGRIRIERDDDIVYPDGGSRRDYIVILRTFGTEFTSSLQCALGEGAVEDVELTRAEVEFLDRFDHENGNKPITNYTRPAGK